VRSATTAVEARRFKGVRCLAADDSAINREVLMEALHRLGVEVTCVENGAEAVEAVRNGTYDILFIDGSMPVMDGFTATREVRKWEHRHGRTPLPVVGLSAHVMGAYAEAWRDSGMSDFITKPFTLEGIRACLGRWVAADLNTAASTSAQSQEVNAGAFSSASPGLLDMDVLSSVREMQPPGTDLVARIVTLYADHAPRMLATLIEAEHAEPAKFASAAHALKSISRNVGALRVGDICGALEDAAREGRTELGGNRDRLLEALDQTLTALAAVASGGESQDLRKAV
jgi:two-component system sensor histidine kinase BarA